MSGEDVRAVGHDSVTVLGLAGNVPRFLYLAIIAGGRREGLFLEVDAIVESVPPLQE